jgi:hypothetical protein
MGLISHISWLISAQTIYAALKSILSSLHKTQGLSMDVWIKDSSLDLMNIKWTIHNKWDYSNLSSSLLHQLLMKP